MASKLSINIDVLLKGAEQIDKLAASLGQLKSRSDGASKSGSNLSSAFNAASATRAADAILREAQALARLQQAQGNVEAASKTLQKAIEGFTGSQIQATRAQIQLTNLQNDYANSPLIGAVRAQSAALQQFGAVNANVEQVLKKTAAANQQVGDSLSDSTAATLAQAQALAQIQTIQGDAAGAAETLATALQNVGQQQNIAVANTEKFTVKLASGLQAGAALLNVISAGFNFFSAIQQESQGGLSEAEAAAKVVSKAFQGSKAAVDAVKNAIAGSVPVVQKLSAEQQSASDKEFTRIGERLAALGAELQRRKEIVEQVAKAGVARVQTTVADPNFGAAFLARIRQVNEAMVKAGQDAATGFSTGLRSGTTSTEKAGEQIGKAAEEGAKKSLEIASPSKVMFRIGQDAIRGFVDGLEKGKSLIKGIDVSSLLGKLGLSGGFDGISAQISQSFAGLRTTFTSVATVATAATVAFGLFAASIASIGAAALIAAPLLFKIGTSGVTANSQLEQTKIGIASVIASVGELNRNGIKLEGADALNAALPLAQKQLQKLRVDALNTALTFEQIAPAFLQAVGPGLGAGLGLDQIRKTVIDLSQLIVPLTGDAAQLGQELRSIFSGDIGPDSQVAKALQITRQEIEAAKEAGTLADLLNKKLAAAAATGALMAGTFEAATSNLAEAGAVLGATVTEGLFKELRDRINKTLPQIFETASGSVKIAPQFAGIANTLTEIFDTAGEIIANLISGIVDGIKGISVFLAANQQQINKIIATTATIVTTAGGIFLSVASSIASATAALVLFGTKIGPVVVGLTTILTLMLAFGPGSTAVATALAVVSRGFTALTASLAVARAALISTSTFLLTTPAGLAILAVALGATALAYLAFGDAQDAAAKRSEAIKIDDVNDQIERLKLLNDQLAQVESLTGSQSNLNAEQETFATILGSLSPKQQEVIKGLAEQKEKVDALKNALKGSIQEQENNARAEQITLAAGIANRQQEIDSIKTKIVTLDGELKKRRELLAIGERIVTETVLTGAETVNVTRDIAEEEANLAAERTKSNEILRERQGLQQQDIDKLNLTATALKQTEEALLKARREGGLTTEQFNSFKAALDNASASGRGIGQAIDDVTAALGGAQTAAQRAKIAIDEFFSSGSTSKLRDEVNKTIGTIVGATAKAGGKEKDAIASLNEAIKANKNGIADNIKNLRLGEKLAKTLNDKINPPARTASTPSRRTPSSAPAQSLLNDRQQLEESLLQIRRVFAERGLQFERLAAQQAEKELEAQFDRREISQNEFFNRKAQLIADDEKREVAAIRRIIIEESARFDVITDRENEGLAAAKKRESDLLAQTNKKAERQKIQLASLNEQEKVSLDAATARNNLTRDIIKLETDLGLVQRKNAAEAKENAAKQIAALNDLKAAITGIPQTLNNAVRTGFDLVIQEFLRQAEDARGLLNQQLQNEGQAIQNAVNAGLISESAARSAILAIEREKRDVLLQQLAIEAKQASQLADPNARAKKLAEIQNVKLQTEALGVDPIFKDIRSGLQNDLAGAFNEFIANAKFNLEGLKNFATGVIDSFRKAIAKALSDRIEKSIVTPITNAFLDKVLGIKTIDPAQIANTVSTDGNTAATIANTAALIASTTARATENITNTLFPQDTQASALDLVGLGNQAGEDVTGPQSGLAGFFDKVTGSFEKFASKLKGLATGAGSGLKSALSSIISLIGSAIIGILGALGGGGAKFSQPPKFTFAEGGYTGDGARHQPAGIVHAGEYVIPAQRVSEFGAGFFEAIRRGSVSAASLGNYLSGLSQIPVRARSGSFASGGLADFTPQQAAPAQAGAQSLRIVNVNDPAQAEEFLSSAAGETVILNRISKSPAKWRAALKI